MLDALLAQSKDADPVVRAAAVLALLGGWGWDEGRSADILARVLEAVLADDASEVRFAAALGSGSGRNVDQRLAALSEMATDRFAAVRVCALVRIMDRAARADEERFREAAHTLLADENPIARALGLFIGAAMEVSNERLRTSLLDFALDSNDPWLDTCAKAIAPAFEGDGPQAMARMADMAASGKPSHQVLGGA